MIDRVRMRKPSLERKSDVYDSAEKIILNPTSSRTAETTDIVLRENKTMRLVFRPLVIDNVNDQSASVRGWFVFQRKSPNKKWEECNSLPLSKLKKDEWVKLELRSAEIKKLLEGIKKRKGIFEKYGLAFGESEFYITTENIESFIRILSKSKNKDDIVRMIESLSMESISNLSDVFPAAINTVKRKKSIKNFELMLEKNLLESEWQKWFQSNDWVLGTEHVEVLDERQIDTRNVSDFLVKTHDGFVDIVEIKRPDQEKLPFWNSGKDHGNMIPSSALTKAIMQSANYIFNLEMEANSLKSIEKIGHKIIKPRCILIFGRSNNWTKEHYESYRILNSIHHNITILTYDQILLRAKKILGLL